MSKGSKRRPRLISREEEVLRYKYAYGEISKKVFNKLLKQHREHSSLKGR